MQQAVDRLTSETERQPLPAAAWIAQLGRLRGNLYPQRLAGHRCEPRHGHQVRRLTFFWLETSFSTMSSGQAAQEAAREAVLCLSSSKQQTWDVH